MPTIVKPLNRILVANRGEIAVRIIRTIHHLGMKAIAVYSQFDKNALHVKLADDAVWIGESEATKSYLAQDKIIEAAASSRADAIHPGYGFLSENSDFASACEVAGITFIGPTSKAMEIMGDKATAKKQMLEIGIPCVSGYQDDDQSDEAFRQAAVDIGYPVILKAAAGGGGRGMRLVEKPDQLSSAIAEARGEALSSFGNDELILEKAISNARHIEFQILGDNFGNIIHLGERDCSLQRRHQKVIEEAPSSAVDDELRNEMGMIAVKAAESVSYRGAGTIEFLLDENGNYFFLEMNTRLQVEHPVTEMVNGMDLVEWQIRIATGEKLGIKQTDIKLTGHAIEARIYAEDPGRNFLPSTGEIIHWREPEGADVRVDSGVVTGDHVGPYYDAMLAKIIGYSNEEENADANRNAARIRLTAALKNTVLLGLANNKQFLLELVGGKAFINGEATIRTIDENTEYTARPVSIEIASLVAVLAFVEKRSESQNKSLQAHDRLLNWSSSPTPPYRFNFECENCKFDIAVLTERFNRYITLSGDEQLRVDLAENKASVESQTLCVEKFTSRDDNFYISSGGRDYCFVDLSVNSSLVNSDDTHGEVRAPMHGVLVEVFVQPGQEVRSNTKLAVLEAMKMRHEILAGVKGVIKTIHKQKAAQISNKELLFEIEESEIQNAASD